MLTHSHYCKACDQTWSCTGCDHDGYLVKSMFHCRPDLRPDPLFEALRKQAAQEKRELITKFNAKYGRK